MRLFCPVGGTGGGPTSAHFPDRLWRYFLESIGRSIGRVIVIATPSKLAGIKISMPELIKNYAELGKRLGVSFVVAEDEQIAESDIDECSHALCISCGNTAGALHVWRQIGLDDKIKKWYRAGVPITGYSAGFIVFFDWASTDSVPGPFGCTYGIMPCMGVISGGAVPHIDTQPMRIHDAQVAMSEMPVGTKALALPEDCMAIFRDEELREVVSCNRLENPSSLTAEDKREISCRFLDE